MVDQKEKPPARPLVDEFIELEVCSGTVSSLASLLEKAGADLIIPALEDYPALQELSAAEEELPAPLVFDLASYETTRCKESSRQFFRQHSLPHARAWPESGLPVIVKPAERSGSEDVRRADSRRELEKIEEEFSDEKLVIEEFISGPVYSLEVIAYGDDIHPLLPTRLEFAPDYDCRQVLAGSMIPEGIVSELEDIARRCARELKLEGIMDIEVIAGGEGMKIMEIDARFPSQTPAAVLAAGGINMVERLAELYLELDYETPPARPGTGAGIYEHILVREGEIKSPGEHIMTEADELKLQEDFFGADYAISDYIPGSSSWRAILIFAGDSAAEVMGRRRRTLSRIERRMEDEPE